MADGIDGMGQWVLVYLPDEQLGRRFCVWIRCIMVGDCHEEQLCAGSESEG